MKIIYINPLPVKILDIRDQEIFSEFAKRMREYTDMMDQRVIKFLSRIQNNLHLQNITSKLEKFYEHDFKSFVDELKKQKVTLSLKDQDEWEDYFNTYKLEINTLQTEIAKTDKEIDQMVYELYGLTDEEIKVVENG